jgi:hypothetical protein
MTDTPVAKVSLADAPDRSDIVESPCHLFDDFMVDGLCYRDCEQPNVCHLNCDTISPITSKLSLVHRGPSFAAHTIFDRISSLSQIGLKSTGDSKALLSPVFTLPAFPAMSKCSLATHRFGLDNMQFA